MALGIIYEAPGRKEKYETTHMPPPGAASMFSNSLQDSLLGTDLYQSCHDRESGYQHYLQPELGLTNELTLIIVRPIKV